MGQLLSLDAKKLHSSMKVVDQTFHARGLHNPLQRKGPTILVLADGVATSACLLAIKHNLLYAACLSGSDRPNETLMQPSPSHAFSYTSMGEQSVELNPVRHHLAAITTVFMRFLLDAQHCNTR